MMVDWNTQPLRTFMFVPGSEREKIAKVDRFGPDVCVIDLEDAVALAEKPAARVTTREAIEQGVVAAPVFVRINALTTGMAEADIAGVVTGGLAGIQLPMVETAAELLEADALIGAAERAAGLAADSVRLLVRFETAKGLAACAATLAVAPPRVLTCGVGLGDLANDLGVDFDPRSQLSVHARIQVALATRAAGLHKPIDGAYPRLDDLEGLEEDSRLSTSLGYQGRLAVHPRQVAVINRVYGTLSEVERRAAQRIVEAFERAEAEGRASIDVDGALVDYPIYHRAKAKLAAEIAPDADGA